MLETPGLQNGLEKQPRTMQSFHVSRMMGSCVLLLVGLSQVGPKFHEAGIQSHAPLSDSRLSTLPQIMAYAGTFAAEVWANTIRVD
jgi:hypothetical protein